MRPLRFLENGNIKGKMTYLEVDKAPFLMKIKFNWCNRNCKRYYRTDSFKERNEYLMYFDQLTSLPNRQKLF